MKFSVSAELPMGAAAYWEVRNSESYLAALASALKMKRAQVLETSVDAATGACTLRLVMNPAVSVPSVVRRQLKGGELSFQDVLTYPSAWPAGSEARECTVVNTNNITDRTDVRGTLRVEPLGAKRCLQTFSGDAKVSVMGLGALVESIIVSELKTTYKKLPRITEEYVRLNPEEVRAAYEKTAAPPPGQAEEEEPANLSVAGSEAFYDAVSELPRLSAVEAAPEGVELAGLGEESDNGSVDSSDSVLPPPSGERPPSPPAPAAKRGPVSSPWAAVVKPSKPRYERVGSTPRASAAANAGGLAAMQDEDEEPPHERRSRWRCLPCLCAPRAA